MRSLSRREKVVVGFTGGVVCTVLIYFLGVHSFLKEWQNSGDTIALLEAKLKRSVLLMKKKKAIETEFQNYTGLLHSRDPDQMRTQTLAEIEKMTREQALKVIEMRPLPTRHQGFFQEYVVEVDLEGTISQMIQFIYGLQKSSGLLKVERLQLTAKSSQSSLLKAVVTLSRLAKE